MRAALAALPLLIAVAFVPLYPAASASAQGPGLAAGKLRLAKMIVAPRRDALVTGERTRLVLRIPKRARAVRVMLNERRVSGRVLTRRSGLRPGINRLLVRAWVGGRVLAEGRNFAVVRHARSLGKLRVRVHRGGRAEVGVRLRGGGLRHARRHTLLRARLNGARVTRDFDSARRPNWRASLSVSHGLRRGTNRLRVLLADPTAGRYVVLRRAFRVRGGRPLAGVGRDRRVLSGTHVRLDGRSSRPARGGRLRYSWTLARRPRGSRAVLRGVGSARPTLRANRPGRYRVRLRVTHAPRARGEGSRAQAAQAVPSVDELTVTVKPSQLLVPFAIDPSGVTIGPQHYPNPSSGGMQMLTVDRSTLNVTTSTYTNAGALRSQLGRLGLDQLVILAAAPANAAVVAPRDVNTFNQALNFMGVPSVPAGTLTAASQQLAIVGVPRAAVGSGWFSTAGQRGWLGVDSSDRFAFSPQTPAIDTSSSSSPTSNTMTIAGQSVTATVSGSGGWQAVALDPYTLEVGASGQWNSSDADTDPELAGFLKSQGDDLVVLQSIGTVPGIDPVTNLGNVAAVLHELGAASPVVSAGGSYAFIGGGLLGPNDVIETSGSVVTDPTTNATMGQSLEARMSPRHADGVLQPTTRAFPGAAASAGMNFGLYDIVHQPASPWPYTAGGPFPQQPGCDPPGNDATAYSTALQQVADVVGLQAYNTDGSNLRNAYVERDQATWSDAKNDLSNQKSPPGAGVSAAQWCNLTAQLQLEWRWLDDVKTMFDSYKMPFLRAGATELVDLQSVGNEIKNSVKPNGNATIFWDLFSVVGEIANLLSFLPSNGKIGALIDSIQAAYDLSSEFATNGGSPVADEVDSKVSQLTNQVASQYSDVAASMDNLRDVVISDYGRLSTLGPLAPTPGWVLDTASTEDIKNALVTGANAWFSEQLFPIAWKAFTLEPSDLNPNPTTDNCSANARVADFYPITKFAEEPAGGQVWLAPRVVALGRGDPNDTGVFASFSTPQATLTDPLFAPPNQNGLGLYKPWFFLRNFTPFGQAQCVDVDNATPEPPPTPPGGQRKN